MVKLHIYSFHYSKYFKQDMQQRLEARFSTLTLTQLTPKSIVTCVNILGTHLCSFILIWHRKLKLLLISNPTFTPTRYPTTHAHPNG